MHGGNHQYVYRSAHVEGHATYHPPTAHPLDQTK